MDKENIFSDALCYRNAFKLMNLPVYDGTIFHASLLIRFLRQFKKKKIGYGHVTKTPTTEVNGNDP